jgi:hypothetical protein
MKHLKRRDSAAASPLRLFVEKSRLELAIDKDWPIRSRRYHASKILAGQLRTACYSLAAMQTRLMLLFLAGCLAYGALPVRGQQVVMLPPRPLSNQDIVRMVRAKFDDATILKAIGTRKSSFDLSVDGMVRLKEAGVSQPIIQAMLGAAAEKKPGITVTTPNVTTAPPTTPAPVAPQTTPAPMSPVFPEEVGVYNVRDGKTLTIEPEIVNWRTGGVVKSAVTLGLDKGHVNGTVAGPRSQLAVSPSHGIEFYIRCLEGNSASEYQLLHFWEKADRREFRSVTGGVLHASGGAENNVVDFHFEKVAPRTYKVVLQNLASGEYGFLAPGAAASADLASRGKVYTFHVVE